LNKLAQCAYEAAGKTANEIESLINGDKHKKILKDRLEFLNMLKSGFGKFNKEQKIFTILTISGYS